MHQIHRLSFESALSLVHQHVVASKPLVGAVRVVTIDGRAGAGKSTLAKHLSPLLGDAPIVHMDDLYRGWGDALTATLTSTLKDQILTPISHGKVGSYRAWDWHRNLPAEVRHIPRHEFLILEGVGASQRVVRPFASTMVWIEIPAPTGLARVLERDATIVADLGDFTEQMQLWQGSEILHFEAENTFDASHLRLDGERFA